MKKNVLYYLVFLFFSFLIIISTIYIIDFFSLKKEAEEESNLLNTIKIEEKVENIQEEIKEDTKIEANEVLKEETERMLQVKTLQEENSDIIGWLEIEGTSINYPVLQGTDNEYYMTHNYKKEKSKNGSIFLTKDYDWKVPSSNLFRLSCICTPALMSKMRNKLHIGDALGMSFKFPLFSLGQRRNLIKPNPNLLLFI